MVRESPTARSAAARRTGTGSAGARRSTSSTRARALAAQRRVPRERPRRRRLARGRRSAARARDGPRAGCCARRALLREAIDAGVRAAVAGEPTDPGALRLIDQLARAAPSRGPRSCWATTGGRVLTERAPADSPRRALGLVALDAARMLGDEQRAGAHPHLRFGDVLGALLRPLAGRPAALVLDAGVRQRRRRRAGTVRVSRPAKVRRRMSRSPVRPRGRRRLRHRDRRARQGRRRAALPRRRHRGPRRQGARSSRSGACSSTATLEPGPAAGRAAPARDPLRRPARRRAGRAGACSARSGASSR